jgi:hypothetical protein
MAVYDDQKESANELVPSDDDLRNLTGINEEQEGAMDREAYNGAASDLASREGLNKPLSDENEDKQESSSPEASKSSSPEGLRAAEGAGLATAATGAMGGNDQVGAKGFTGGIKGTGKQKALKRFMGRARENRKQLIMGGGAAGGIGIALVAAFFALIPLKIEHIVDNLDNRFMSTSNSAVENETNNMFKDYIEKFVGPNLTKKSCGTTLSKDCTVNVLGVGSNPVTNLYKTWSQAKLENKLATDYHIEIRYDSASKKYFMKAPGLGGDGEAAISEAGQPISDELFTQVDRGTVKSTLNNALSNETHYKQIMYRFKFGRLLEEKYGIRRFIPNALQDFADKKTVAAQIYLTQRVLIPRTDTLGIVFECLLDPNCVPTSTSPTSPTNGTTAELNGAPESVTEGQIRTNLSSLAESYGITDEATVKGMIDDYNKLEEKGYSSYLIDAVLEKLWLSDLSGQVADAVPVIGWINLASQIIHVANSAGPTLKKLSYVTNATAAVSLYMTYRSYADQIHSGNVDATEVGSWVNSLGPGDNGPASDPEIGGTAGAEGTPLYASYIDGGSSSDTTTSASDSIISSLVAPKAYAQSTTSTGSSSSPSYLCNDGTTVPEAKLVCPEEAIGEGGNGVANSVHGFLNTPGISLVTQAANIIASTVGKITQVVGDVLSKILGPLLTLVSFVFGALQPVFKAAVNELIPNPFGSNMSGGRTFDLVAGGDNVASYDNAHDGQGGRALTSADTAEITQQQEDEAQQEFDQQPFFARMFSTTDPDSLISKLAMDVPIESAGGLMQTSFSSLMSNPFSKLLGSMGSIFSHKVSAQTVDASCPGPFGVTCYGYTQADIDAIGDPSTYWDNNDCSDNSTNGPNYKWNLAASKDTADTNNDAVDPGGMPYNTTTDPCLLISQVVGDAGGYFDSSNLTSDDLLDISGASASSSTSSSPSGSTSALNIASATQAAQQASTGGTQVGFSVWDASSGKSVGSLNATSQNYGASITKSMLLVAYLTQVGSGTLSAEAKSELTNMIENSDNNSANWVYQHLNNASSAVANVASTSGMTGFTLDTTSDPVYVLGQSKITANDFAEFFSKIDTMLPAAQKDFGLGLLSHLSVADQVGLLQAGIPGTVYSKEGWKPEPSGTAGAPYVVNQAAQFTINQHTYGVAVTVSGTANQSSGETIVQDVVTALLSQGSG